MQLSSPIVLSSEADEMALLCVSSEKVNAKKKRILRSRTYHYSCFELLTCSGIFQLRLFKRQKMPALLIAHVCVVKMKCISCLGNLSVLQISFTVLMSLNFSSQISYILTLQFKLKMCILRTNLTCSIKQTRKCSGKTNMFEISSIKEKGLYQHSAVVCECSFKLGLFRVL